MVEKPEAHRRLAHNDAFVILIGESIIMVIAN